MSIIVAGGAGVPSETVPLYETILVDGVNLADIITCITSLDGIYATPETRGENVVFPGVDGEMWVDKPIATNIQEFGISLVGNATMAFNDSYRLLRKLVPPGKLLNLQRRMSYSTGNETHTAIGEFAGGLAPTMGIMRFGRTTLALKIHSGVWYSTDTYTINTTGGTDNVVVQGEARTHRMTITMPAGGTLNNTTNGFTVSNTLAGGGASVIVDVENFTATQSAVDVSYSLVWSKKYPMRLQAGANQFTGSASTIVYYAGYL